MIHQLAHNFLRLADWEHRVLKHSAYIAPNTVAAWNFFIDGIAAQHEIKTDQPFVALGDILYSSGQAVLSAVAYDPCFNAILFTDQFIKGYVPGAEKRSVWIGAHPVRIKYFLLGIGQNLSRLTINDSTIDAYIRDTIRRELLLINSVLNKTYEEFSNKLDRIDPVILEEKRQPVIFV